MRKNNFFRPGGVYEPTNQPRLGFFCDLAFSLAFVSEFAFCKIANLYFLISVRFSSALITPSQSLRVNDHAWLMVRRAGA